MTGDVDLFAASSRGEHSGAAERYVVVDVFTDTPLQGNQLGVFTDARDLAPEQMQRLAREVNFSETVFLLPPEHEGHARARTSPRPGNFRSPAIRCSAPPP